MDPRFIKVADEEEVKGPSRNTGRAFLGRLREDVLQWQTSAP
jgi:hypothetical protein